MRSSDGVPSPYVKRKYGRMYTCWRRRISRHAWRGCFSSASCQSEVGAEVGAVTVVDIMLCYFRFDGRLVLAPVQLLLRSIYPEQVVMLHILHRLRLANAFRQLSRALPVAR